MASIPWPWGAADGTLTCETCGSAHAITGGVARLVDPKTICEVKAAEQSARDQGAKAYDGRMSKLRGKAEVPSSLRALDPRASDVVAELGAGTGRMTVQYARDVACVVALDFSFESLLVLRDRLEPELRDKVVLVQADLCHLPLADGAFHKVASFQVLEHVPTPSARASALREARRVIRRGGRFVASVYNWSRSKQRRAARGVGDNSRKEGSTRRRPPSTTTTSRRRSCTASSPRPGSSARHSAASTSSSGGSSPSARRACRSTSAGATATAAAITATSSSPSPIRPTDAQLGRQTAPAQR